MSGTLETPARLTVPPYLDGAAELSDHLLRLNRLLRDAVDRFRHATEHRNGLGGVAIFDDEVDHFLTTPLDQGQTPPDAAAADDRQRCELRTAATANLNIELPIDLLRQRFQLSDIEVDTLLHCLAAELHPGYGRVFAYLNNDLTRQRPSVALIVDVLGASWPERLAVRRALGPRSALFRFGLLVSSGASQLTAELTAERSVLDFVLGAPSRPQEQAPTRLDDLFISPAERVAIEQTISHLSRLSAHGPESAIVVMSGAPGVGRRTCARAICHHLGRQLAPPKASPQAPATAGMLIADLPSWLRDARLAGQVPGIYVPRESGEEPSPLPLLVDGVVAAGGGLTFMFVEADEPPRLPSMTVNVLKLHLDTPTAAVRSRVWRQALRQRGLSCADELIAPIAAIYPFNAGRIHACAREAELKHQELDHAALAQICRGQTHHHLERLAQPLPTRHGWDDIVLPPDELSRLKEIANAVRNRDRVMQDWGFGRKVSAGPGVNAIFFGPSGTGKTMAASILAGELGIAIYRVDLSRVVSKYIGETERNLEALFEEARRSFALLFFDEAEALFGKRSEVKDAHDRYANIEVAYLLQRMEQFEGIAILATNLRTHLDTAFLRRLQFAVEFPLPTVADRLRIWRQVWPASALLGDDLDLEFMAAHLELAGGHIRNVALTAAYLASEEPSAISMKHLVAGTRRELQKLGRSCVPDQFGRYASLFGAS